MAKPKDKQPWFKFYPQDWRGDAKLRMCSIAARGLWAEMLCVMHEAEPYGHMLIEGKPVVNRQIAALAGISLSECGKLMCELESAGVYSRTDDKVIFSRRMVRDRAKAERDRENGKGGGNPKIVIEDNAGVNPPVKGRDKAQKPLPEATSKTSAAAAEAVLDEGQEKQIAALKALFVALRVSKGWASPNLDHLRVWVSEGISSGTISSACTPILKRKEDMVSIVYCDGAVRDAHAASPGLQQVVSNGVWIDEGTLEFNAHMSEAFRKTGRGIPVVDQKDESGHRTGRRGWYVTSTWPEGYNEFGERVPPETEDAA